MAVRGGVEIGTGLTRVLGPGRLPSMPSRADSSSGSTRVGKAEMQADAANRAGQGAFTDREALDV